MWLTGRYGYNKNFPGNGGGINTKRLKSSSTSCPLKKTREYILNLLNLGRHNKALDHLINCSVSNKQKEIFFDKYF